MMIDKKERITTLRTQSRSIVGLHRPFNKPLKSLCWVCSYAKKWPKNINDNFYYCFYIHHVKEIIRHQHMTNKWNEGCISLQDAMVVNEIMSKSNLRVRIVECLHKRNTEEDKLIYQTYKKASYYISLSKKLGLLDANCRPTSDGLQLAAVNSNFYVLNTDEKKLILSYLLEVNPDLMIALIITQSEVEQGKYPSHLSLIFQKSQGKNFDKGYIRSFKHNYLPVMTSWFSQLNITKKKGGLKKEWEIFMQSYPTYYSKYKEQLSAYKGFKEGVLKQELAKKKRYKKFTDIYNSLYKQGQADLGFVNLYDIMSKMRMGYERFSKFINDFYTENRKKVIILFSNTVSSIDKRPRFRIGDKIVLKIKLIKMIDYEVGDTLGEFNA